MLYVGIAGMGVGCLDGMVIIGHRYSKSTFGVNNNIIIECTYFSCIGQYHSGGGRYFGISAWQAAALF